MFPGVTDITINVAAGPSFRLMKHCPKQHLEQASVAEGMRTGHLGVCNPFGTYYYTVVSLIMTISSHTKELKHLGLRNKSTWV